ncbi:MAG: AMP-binding protein [Actinomycetota bacterium]
MTSPTTAAHSIQRPYWFATDTWNRLLQRREHRATTAAVEVAGRACTYGELFDRAEAIASSILGHGDGPRRLLINAPKSVDAYAALLAALGTGTTFCTLNVDAPPGRNDLIIEDFDPTLVLSDDEFGYRSARIGSLPEVTGDGGPGRPPTVLAAPTEPTRCAYVMYTSGTSGRPKGVQISYRNLGWFLETMLQRLGLTEPTRWAHHANLAFDLTILDALGALTTRSTILPVTGLASAFPGRFIEENQVEVWPSVPSIVPLLQRLGAGEADQLRSVRKFLLGGEALLREWVDYLLTYAAPDAEIFNCYGPTEGTVYCSVERVTAGYHFEPDEPSISIGTPLAGVGLSAVPGRNGLSGLEIDGAGVGLGYLRRGPGETDGYSGELGGHKARYATGDLVEEVNGRLYYRGRADFQVKLRGHRYELSELEGVMSALGLADAYAVVVDDSVAIALHADNEITDGDLLDRLAPHVPDFALPRAIVRLDTVPRSVNDKVDRGELARLVGESGS